MGIDKTDSIYVWVETIDKDKFSALPSPKNIAHSSIEVSANILAQNLQSFLKYFQSIFNGVPNDFDYDVESIELNLVVNAQGGIELIGKISTGVTTSIKVLLTRKEK